MNREPDDDVTTGKSMEASGAESNVGARGSAERDRAIGAAVARARQSSFYAGHLPPIEVRGRADLTRLPLTFKTDLARESPYGMLAVPPAKAWHYHETSGTTGEPISTWCGLTELRAMARVVHRMVPELAYDTILLNRFPLFAPVSFVFEEALRLAGACHIAAGNMSWDVPFPRALDFLGRLGATALSSLPLEPILLNELAKQEGMDVRRDLPSLGVIFLGGAILPPALRRAIEQDWDARVVEIYGSNETMLLGVSCTAGRLHLCDELVEAEILDAGTHQPVQAGEVGVLTVTSLVHEAMPLVRYFTGDLVRPATGDCPCGREALTVDVLGRMEDVIEMGGARVTHHDLLDAAYHFADRLGTRIFFVVVRRRRLHLLIEGAIPERIGDADLERELADRVGLPVTIEYLERNEVLDRSALFRGPKIYKPSVISDWRDAGRKPITIMEALLEWPKFDAKTLFHLLRRQIRNGMRRRRLLREDRADGA